MASEPPLQHTDVPSIVLLRGCVTQQLDPTTLTNAEKILTHLGISVQYSDNCCGALAFHNGQALAAREQAKVNQSQLWQHERPILFLATGCGAFLKEYAIHFPHDHLRAFSHQAQDICDFLAHVEWPSPTHLPKLNIAIHTPCSAKNALRNPDATQRLLRRLPNLRMTLLNSAYCCGGAGSYPLKYPRQADALIDHQIQTFKAPYPDYLVTNNLGCALQFASSFKYHKINTRVVHPLTLVAMAFGLT